jgi:LysR family transcriptional activator of nhaA
MAMLRLLARETEAITLVPRVVVQDELKTGTLVELYRIGMIRESFYAITPARQFPNLLVKELLQVTKLTPRGQKRKKAGT